MDKFTKNFNKLVPKQVKNAVVTGIAKVEQVQKEGISALAPQKQEKSPKKGRDDNQIAGHDADEFGRKRMLFEDGKVYKLYDPEDVRGLRERKLYEKMNAENPEAMGTIVPKYFGTTKRQDDEATQPGDYVIMENIFHNLNDGKDLCLADIKIGDTPTPFERKKDLGSKQLNDLAGQAYKRTFVPNLDRYGFQVLGIKVRNSDTGEVEKFGKSLGRATEVLGIDFIVGKFFLGCKINETYRVQVIKDLIEDLVAIEGWLSTQTKYKFRGSSLVLAYIPETVCGGMPSVGIRPPPLEIPENSGLLPPDVITGTTPTPSSIPFAGMDSLPAESSSKIPEIQPEISSNNSIYPNLQPIQPNYPNMQLNQQNMHQNNINLTHTNSFPNKSPFVNHTSITSLPNLDELKINQENRQRTGSYPVIPTIGPLTNTSTKKAIVRLIDFNNWADGEGKIDEDSLKGVSGLIRYLRDQITYKDE